MEQRIPFANCRFRSDVDAEAAKLRGNFKLFHKNREIPFCNLASMPIAEINTVKAERIPEPQKKGVEQHASSN